jgi:hypothetical protein
MTSILQKRAGPDLIESAIFLKCLACPQPLNHYFPWFRAPIGPAETAEPTETFYANAF